MIEYDKVIAGRVRMMQPSGIRKFFEMLGDRPDVISLTVGQPDFVTPYHIREAAIRSVENGKTWYTANLGMPALREQISAYLARRFSLSYDAKKEILVSVGGSEAIDIALRALIEPGDEVILPLPAFVCYAPLAELYGAVVKKVITKEENAYKITPQELRAAITPRTKLLILPYPNNPTGAILTRQELQALADVLRGTNVMVLSDEIYAELTYGMQHTSIAAIDGMRERVILVSGFSKAWAMTGWRLGYLCAPREIVSQIYKIHQYGIMCAPTASQFAAIEAMKNGDEDVLRMTAEYNRRRIMILDAFQKIGIQCFEPQGAFYVFPHIAPPGQSSEQFCRRLLDEAGVAIVPGSAFGEGGEGCARISYAYSVSHISQALERIASFMEKEKARG